MVVRVPNQPVVVDPAEGPSQLHITSKVQPSFFHMPIHWHGSLCGLVGRYDRNARFVAV